MKLFICLFSKYVFDLFICLIVYIYHFYIFFKWLIHWFICSLFVLIKTLFYLFILLFGCLLFIFVFILLSGYCLFIIIYNLFRTLFKVQNTSHKNVRFWTDRIYFLDATESVLLTSMCGNFSCVCYSFVYGTV